MKSIDYIQLMLYFAVLLILSILLGRYMALVFQGKKHFMKPVFGWLERGIYRFCRIDATEESGWKAYARDVLIFSGMGIVFVFLLQLCQNFLPFTNGALPKITWHSALNTAVSFVTNTNWQGYSGETTMSYFAQMTGLTVQNFVSAAAGIAVLLSLIRGLIRTGTDKIGNFWVDLTRSVLYVLLPLSVIWAVLLVGQGVIQNLNTSQAVETITGSHQIIPMGPAASQVAIKQLGTNGGGFFGTNSAHPFENPTPFSNFLEMLAILLIPASLPFTFGKMTGNKKQGWIIFITMFILLLVGFLISYRGETVPVARLGGLSLMEGKETRFGIMNSVLWSVETTAASSGSVNAMLDSFSPLSGFVCMLNIMLGEVIFGGVGSGLYGMLVFIFLTVFIAGLMVGRTPEFLGKKIEAFEMKMSVIAALLPGLVILIFTGWALGVHAGIDGLENQGPHGLSEIIYAYSSAAGNNGSAFGGLQVNTPFYNLTLTICMLIGRFGVIVPVLAIAGSLAGKKIIPVSAGTFRTDNGLFVFMLIVVILIIGGLTFFPALSFGPIVEQLLLSHSTVSF